MAPVLLTKNDPNRGPGQLLTCLQKGNGNLYHALKLAEDAPYHRNPLVADAIKQLIETEYRGPTLEQKTAVGAATTAQTGWASEVAPNEIFRQMYLAWEGRSIVGRVLAMGARRVPWHATTSTEALAGSSAGTWRGESLGSIVVKGSTSSLRIDYREPMVIMVASAEAFRFGAVPELALGSQTTEAVTTFTDSQFLDPTITATSARPASVTNGAQPVTSTGSSAAQIVADLASMVALMQILSDGDAWVLIMRPVTYYVIAAKFAGAGMPITPGFLLGIPVVLGAKSPKQVTLLDVSNLAYASDDQVVIDISKEASVQMDNTITQSGVAGTGSATVSLWQTGMVGVRATIPIAWQTIRYSTSSPSVSAGCVYMPVTY